MADGTSQSSDRTHPPFSHEWPLDTELEIFPREIENTIEDEIAKVKTFRGGHSLENIPKYPEPHILALFANLAYKEAERIHNALADVGGWQLLATAKSPKGYFGACFWHPQNHHVVIAHRGTDPFKFWTDFFKTDVIEVFLNKFGPRVYSAATFSEKIRKLFDGIGDEYHIELFFTGHSLGGWLAQVTTFTTEYLRPVPNSKGRHLFQNPSGSDQKSTRSCHAHAVTFESPGCAKMLLKMRSKFDVRSRYCSIDLDSLDVTNYFLAPNVINTCHEHVGTSYRLVTGLSKRKLPSNVIGDVKYTLKAHSMDRIQILLKGLVGKTIDEVRNKVKEVVDWPKFDGPRRKEFKKLFKDGILNWENHYHCSRVCLDKNGYCVIRYRTNAFNELSGHLSIFTANEQRFLERYLWMREFGLQFFTPHEWVRCLENDDQKNKTIDILRDFRIVKKKKFECATPEQSKEFAPLVKNLLKLCPTIYQDTEKSLTAKEFVKKIFQAETKIYLENLKSSTLDVDVDSFGVRGFIDEHNTRKVWHAIAPESTGDKKIGMILVYSAFQKILVQQRTIIKEESQYTILKLKRFLQIMRHEIVVGYIFEDVAHLLILDCMGLELDNEDKKSFRELLIATMSKPSVKLIFVCDNEKLEVILKDLLGKHNVSYVKSKLPSLKLKDLEPKFQKQLMTKRIRLTESPTETPLNRFLGESALTELDAKSIMELIKAEDVIRVGKEPQRMSDLEAAYSKCNDAIKAPDLLRALTRKENDSTLFIISGCSSQSLIKELGVEDDTKVRNYLEARISTENGFDKNISLITGEYTEQEFRRFCHDHPTSRIHWISYKFNNEWFWNLLYDLGFYVERKLNRIAVPANIKSNLKDENSVDSFFVSGITEKQLLKLLKKGPTEKLYMSRLKVDDEFDGLGACAESNGNQTIHLLKADTVTNSSNVRQLVRFSPASTSVDTEETFFASLREPLSIIIDHPGMGKSTSLTRLTEQRMSENWVIRLNLKNCSQMLNGLPAMPNVDQVIDFVWEASGEKVQASLAKAIFKHHVQNAKADFQPLLLLFDGFDEINLVQQKKIIELLKLLREKFEKSKHQIVVTSRRHPELEKKLDILYMVEFTPLDNTRQIQFLTNLWLSRSELRIKDFTAHVKPERFAEELLRKVECTLRENTAVFIGVPMQLRLLMEGYHEEFLEFANSDCSDPLLESISILDIYEFFVGAKFDLLYKEKTRFSEMSYPVYERWVQEKFTQIHQSLARSKLLTEKNNALFERCSPDDDEFIELYRLGLIQMIGGGEDYEFIHFTFVEYYVANSLVQKLPEFTGRVAPKRPLMNFLLKAVLILPKYKVVRNFLDSMLDRQAESVFESRRDSNYTKVKGEYLHVAVSEGNCGIIKLLFAMIDIETLKSLLSFRAVRDGDLKFLAPLHIATQKGNVKILQLLLENEFINVNVRTAFGEKRTSLHIAAEKGDSVIVKTILSNIGENELGAAVNAEDFHKLTPLHLAAEEGHDEVVKILLQTKNIEVNTKGGKMEETPLHLAVRWGRNFFTRYKIEEDAAIHHVNSADPFLNLLPDDPTISFKSQLETDEFEKEQSFHTPEFKEKLDKRIAVVKHSIGFEGIEVNSKNINGMTPLHLASENNNYDAVEILLTAVDINANDKCGCHNKTALQLAIDKGFSKVEDLLKAYQNAEGRRSRDARAEQRSRRRAASPQDSLQAPSTSKRLRRGSRSPPPSK